MSDECVSFEDHCTPSVLRDIANPMTLNLPAEKLYEQYGIAYNGFKKWCADKKAVNFTESVRLAYFSEKSKQVQLSSLWLEYSMIRASLSAKCNRDISKYGKVIAFVTILSLDLESINQKYSQERRSTSFLKRHRICNI